MSKWLSADSYFCCYFWVLQQRALPINIHSLVFNNEIGVTVRIIHFAFLEVFPFGEFLHHFKLNRLFILILLLEKLLLFLLFLIILLENLFDFLFLYLIFLFLNFFYHLNSSLKHLAIGSHYGCPYSLCNRTGNIKCERLCWISHSCKPNGLFRNLLIIFTHQVEHLVRKPGNLNCIKLNISFGKILN